MLDYNEEVAKVEHLRDNPKIGLGGKPALIVVDFQLAFTTHGRSDTESTLRATAKLLEKAAALYDLADRYADVVLLEQMLKYLDKVGAPATAGV